MIMACGLRRIKAIDILVERSFTLSETSKRPFAFRAGIGYGPIIALGIIGPLRLHKSMTLKVYIGILEIDWVCRETVSSRTSSRLACAVAA